MLDTVRMHANMHAMKTAIYLRVSTDEQHLGMEAQLERTSAYALLRGWEVEAVYSDKGVSGSTDPEDRPGALRMLRDAAAGLFDVVLVLRVDRLVRSAETTLRVVRELGESGVGFVSATEPIDSTSPIGKAMLGMLAVFAQLERDMIAARTKEALAAARAKGTVLGAPRFKDAQAITLASNMRANGSTLAQIRNEFVAQGVPTVRGGEWTETAISRLLKRAA